MSKIKEQFKTSIGGQAVIEGVMMRGPQKTALSVRIPDGTIDTSVVDTPGRKWYNKIPFLRGTFNFVGSMKMGYKSLMDSAEKSGFDDVDEEPSKLEKLLGDKFMAVLVGISGILGVVIAVMLFTVLPAFITSKISLVLDLGVFKNIFEGAIRIAVFILYVWVVGFMSDIKRVFEYHGAEHKTIACYEAGLELTPENAKKCTRFHPRCGTSFLLISIIVSILVSSFLTWDVLWVRIVLKLLLLPIVLGISYEIIQWAGRSDNIITRIISKPGLWTQKLTTKEPDYSQLEVAIASMKAVIPADSQLEVAIASMKAVIPADSQLEVAIASMKNSQQEVAATSTKAVIPEDGESEKV